MPHVELSPAQRRLVTAGLLLGMSLGALEATVVGTAMPTVVATLGGLHHYSWVFSAYLLTSTASVPIWGRLSDLYGRRRPYFAGVVIFLTGSMLCGAAQSMTQLVIFRAMQGIGAGALIPLAMTIIGEIYTLAERGRMQAVFSGVWGVASIGGPMVGGWLTDALSWRWVFYINIPPGILGALLIASAYPRRDRVREVAVDWTGAALLFAAVAALLGGLSAVTASAIPWFAGSAILAMLFVIVERRASEPILPTTLFANRIVSYSLATVFLLGMAMFGAIAFIPLFVQGAMGGTATQAGGMLTPLFLGWVFTSIVSAQMTARVGYRLMTRIGIVLMLAGFFGLSQMATSTARSYVFVVSLVLGGGMGFSMLALLLALQHGVARAQLGLATSMNQFCRSIGAAIGVAAMGAILSLSLGRGLDVEAAVGAGEFGRLNPLAAARLASGLRMVFGAGLGICALSAVPALLLPPLDFARGVPAGAGEQLLAAEMTNLEPEDEPSSVS